MVLNKKLGYNYPSFFFLRCIALKIFHHISVIAPIYCPTNSGSVREVWAILDNDIQFERLTYGQKWSYIFVLLWALDNLHNGSFNVNSLRNMWNDITPSHYENFTCKRIEDSWYVIDDFDQVRGMLPATTDTLSIKEYQLAYEKVRHSHGAPSDFIITVE